MNYKLIIFVILLLPLAGMTQTSFNWQLFLNQTKLLSASVDSLTTIQLSKQSTGIIKISFLERDTAFKRTVLLMNKQRNSLLQKEMEPSCKTVSFPVADLLSKTGRQPFTIYIVDIPSDPAKAMLVRVAPLAICDVEWKE